MPPTLLVGISMREIKTTFWSLVTIVLILSCGLAKAEQEQVFRNRYIIQLKGILSNTEFGQVRSELRHFILLKRLSPKRSHLGLSYRAASKTEEPVLTPRSLEQTDSYQTYKDSCRKLLVRDLVKVIGRNLKRGLLKKLVKCSPDGLLNVERTSNDYYSSLLWGMYNSNDVDIDAREAWDQTTGNSSTVVGIVDTGILYTHPDLAQNMWVNTEEIAGNGIDDDDNGYVDDIYGINAITGSGNPLDDHGHGTHCAGTIGGAGNNSIGVVGVNWQVSMMALKFLSSSGSGSTADAIETLNYVAAMKDRGENIVATNNSWGGGGYSSSLLSAIEAQRERGILFLAAAGNSGKNNDTNGYYPTNYDIDNIISVAAVDSDGNLASFSNYGASSVEVGAPGVSIASAYLNNSYVYMSGTSMATPHVSGIAALVAGAFPDLTYRELRQAIISGGKTLASLNRKTSTGKLVSAAGALEYASSLSEPDPTPTPGITPDSPTPTPTPNVSPSPSPTEEPEPESYVIGGSVKIGRGRAVSGAKIVLVTIDSDDVRLVSYASTDSDGQFTFNNISDGSTYLLSVSKRGMRFRPAFSRGTFSSGDINVEFSASKARSRAKKRSKSKRRRR